ncbi:uncharacterized protein LOC120898702 [Anopheles arabiensis]|uniref:uncharacterized protein LOC120898702 n=1 Tax=Anopheles arabiensis TaxID=7173 RepID=UPI001AAD1199|nr:uncharacterized protein LOC120898702 [Anopheles arabiensis]
MDLARQVSSTIHLLCVASAICFGCTYIERNEKSERSEPTSQSSRDEVELRSFYQMTAAIRDRRFKECSLLLHSCFLFQAGVLGEARAHVFRLSAHIHTCCNR